MPLGKWLSSSGPRCPHWKNGGLDSVTSEFFLLPEESFDEQQVQSLSVALIL